MQFLKFYAVATAITAPGGTVIDQLYPAVQPGQDPPAQTFVASLQSEEIVDALRVAIRHGRPDLARRLAERLTQFDRDLRVYYLADAAGGGR